MDLKIITLSGILCFQFFRVEALESLLSKELSEGIKAEEIISECLKLKDKEKDLLLQKLYEISKEFGGVKSELRVYKQLKWLVTAREGIEDTEIRYANSINLKIPSNMTDIFEIRKESRKQRFLYILKEKKHESFVENLHNRIEENGMSVHEFCNGIAEAHYFLSRIIKNSVLKQGQLEICYSYRKYDPEHEKVNAALKVFTEGLGLKKNFDKVLYLEENT